MLLREGGWVVPLDCQHPVLQAWLQYIEGAQRHICALFGKDACPEELIVDADAPCQNNWTPLT